MSATLTLGDIKVGSSIVTGEFVDQIQSDIDEMPLEIAPLVNYFGYGEALKFNEDWTVKWMRSEAMDTKITLNNSVSSASSSLSLPVSAADAALLQVGAVVQILGANEEAVRVTANDGAGTVTVSRDYWNDNSGTGPAHASGDTAYILLPSYLDTDTFPASPRKKGWFETNYALQAMFSWSQTDYQTGRVSYLQNKQSQQARDVARGREFALKQLNNSIIYGKAIAPNGTAYPYFKGLRAQIGQTNTVTSSGLLTATDIEDAMEKVRRKDASPKRWTALMNRNAIRIFNAVFRAHFSMQAAPDATTIKLNQVRAFETDLGVVEIMEVPQMPDNEILLISNKADIKLHPIAVEGMGTGWVTAKRGAPELNARKESDMLSWIGTLIVRNEARHAKIKGFTSTLGSYPGSI